MKIDWTPILLIGTIILLWVVMFVVSETSPFKEIMNANVTETARLTLVVDDFYHYNHADNATLLYCKDTGKVVNDEPAYNVAYSFNDTNGRKHIASMTVVNGFPGWSVTNDGWGNAIITYEAA